jgi:hypothetical protein
VTKVIGFDNWTGGAHHFARLVEAFNNKGLDLSLIHLGSWGNDRGRPASETIGSLQVRDISWYGSKGFSEILAAENPSAVLFMSTDTFAHRAFNRYCRDRGVPTVHLYHGVVRVQAVDDGLPYRVNIMSQLRFVSSKILKALKYVWPTYALALWKTGAAVREWFRFGRDILTLALGRYTQRSADDARTDRCCVYVAADIEHAVTKYAFRPEDVTAVGNPDLIHFGLTSLMIGSHLVSRPVESAQRSAVMYIDTALLLTGFVFKSATEFVQHMIDTRDELQRQGKRLVFKPHPAHLKTEIRDAFVESGIDMCSDKDFMSTLQQCCACIVETSSLALIPALMGMPLFLAQYGRLNSQRFGEVLTSYPRARLLPDLGSFSSLLAAECRECDPERTRAWIAFNAGPLPAEDMPHRVAQVVEATIRQRQETNAK